MDVYVNKVTTSYDTDLTVITANNIKENIGKTNKIIFETNAQCCDIMNNLIKEETIENLKNKKVIFCDLDGTLIETISGEPFPKGIWDMRIRFDVLDAIKKLNPEYILIVSNQGGIESGFVDRDDFRSKSEYITRAIREYCGCKCYGMYCETNNKSDLYRKPNTGMLENLMESYVGDDFDYIKQKSLMIGDASGKKGQFSDSDKKTAENFGIDYMDVNDFVNTNWED